MEISHRTSLVTGGTGGIGREVAFALAKKGTRVLLLGRNEERAAQVLDRLRALGPGLDHAFIQADLSLMSETARAANDIARSTAELDSLVFCAGILSFVPEWTQENLERSFALNYLSRYLLVRRLLPMLCKAPSGRVVFVANAGVYRDTLDFADLQHRKGSRGLHVAGRTQFANDLLAIELAQRMRATRLEVTCVFPGPAKTDVFRNARGIPWYLRWLVPVLERTAQPAEQAAYTPTFLASAAEAVGASGRFFGPRMKERRVPPRAQSRERGHLLWTESEWLVRHHMNEPSSSATSVAQHAPGVARANEMAD